jgi:hypothetical protein
MQNPMAIYESGSALGERGVLKQSLDEQAQRLPHRVGNAIPSLPQFAMHISTGRALRLVRALPALATTPLITVRSAGYEVVVAFERFKALVKKVLPLCIKPHRERIVMHLPRIPAPVGEACRQLQRPKHRASAARRYSVATHQRALRR